MLLLAIALQLEFSLQLFLHCFWLHYPSWHHEHIHIASSEELLHGSPLSFFSSPSVYNITLYCSTSCCMPWSHNTPQLSHSPVLTNTWTAQKKQKKNSNAYDAIRAKFYVRKKQLFPLQIFRLKSGCNMLTTALRVARICLTHAQPLLAEIWWRNPA